MAIVPLPVVVKFLVCTTHEKFWNVARKKFFAKNSAASNGNFTTTGCVITPTSAVLSKKFLVHHISKSFVSQRGANWEILLLNFAFVRGVQIAKKIFPPKNLIYGFWRENISYSHFLSPYFTADTAVLDTRCLCRCCCLRILEPGGLELLNLGLLGRRPIYNYSNCGIFWWIIRSWNLNRKLSKSKFLPAVGLELLNPGLLGCRLIH